MAIAIYEMIPKAAVTAAKEEKEGASMEQPVDQPHDLPTSSSTNTIIFSCPTKVDWLFRAASFCVFFYHIILMYLYMHLPLPLAFKLNFCGFVTIHLTAILSWWVAIFPYRLEVHSDATLRVRTLWRSFCYPRIVGACPERCVTELWKDRMNGRRIHCSAFSNVVLVTRLDPDVDIVIMSPADLDGFLLAIEKVVNNEEPFLENDIV
jgi:hypothetical protein